MVKFVWWMDDATMKAIPHKDLVDVVHLMSVYFRENQEALNTLKEEIAKIIGPEPK